MFQRQQVCEKAEVCLSIARVFAKFQVGQEAEVSSGRFSHTRSFARQLAAEHKLLADFPACSKAETESDCSSELSEAM